MTTKKTAEAGETKVASEETMEVVVAESTAVVASEEKSLEDMLSEDAGLGSEFIGMRERQIPFLATLQGLSPVASKGGPEYIKGAESSMIFNTLTRELFHANIADEEKGQGILVLPVHFKTKRIEWKKRTEGSSGGGGGGGVVRVWGDDESYTKSSDFVFDAKRNKWGNPANNSEVSDHYDTYLIQVGYFGPPTKEFPGGELHLIDPSEAVLSCKGSQVKKARAWNGERMQRRMTVKGRSLQAPSWFDAWRIQTKYEQNDQGNWFGYVITRFGETLSLENGMDLYMMARKMHKNIQEGLIVTDDSQLASGEAASNFVDEEVPF